MGEHPLPDISVVIPVKNGAASIHAQLAALAAQQGGHAFEVVISDNGSTDDLQSALAPWTGRLDIRLVDSSERAGVSHARNIGAHHARGSKILFCDADDAVSPRWVSGLVAALDDHEIAGGWVEVRDVNPSEVLAWTTPPPVDSLPVTMRFLPYAIGCCLGVRSTTLARYGGFDESYVGGHEEVDLAWKIQRDGGSIGFAPDSFVHYRLRGTVPALMRQRYRYGFTYAQLFANFRHEDIPRTPLRLELRKIGHVIRQGPSQWRNAGTRGRWCGQTAWIAGRLHGDLTFRVRAPQ